MNICIFGIANCINIHNKEIIILSFSQISWYLKYVRIVVCIIGSGVHFVILCIWATKSLGLCPIPNDLILFTNFVNTASGKKRVSISFITFLHRIYITSALFDPLSLRWTIPIGPCPPSCNICQLTIKCTNQFRSN